jgi:hypothetical protein
MHARAFRPRFRRAALGWKGSKFAIERIDEARAQTAPAAPTPSPWATISRTLTEERKTCGLLHIVASRAP